MLGLISVNIWRICANDWRRSSASSHAICDRERKVQYEFGQHCQQVVVQELEEFVSDYVLEKFEEFLVFVTQIVRIFQKKYKTLIFKAKK